MKKYMHTMDGQPAYFDPESKQIYFACRGKRGAVRVVDSLDEIHKNEKVSAKTRLEKFGETARVFKMGWVNVIL